MEDNSRINRRSRPRPYDLRRKVLLKNFLREQMTHISIPEVRIESASQDNNVSFEEESSVSIHLDEDLPELNEESALPEPENAENSSCDNSELNLSAPDPMNVLDNIVDNSSDSNPSCDSVDESSLFKFASLVKIKKESKKTLKGIFKAKDVCKSPMKTRSFKSGLERVFYGRKRQNEREHSNRTTKSSPRSLFSLFKHRKEQRNLKDTADFKRSTCVNLKASNVSSKYSTLNQSVQTDDSWTKQELIRVQESNKRLKEENRLLSESLSYFMSNSSMDHHVKQSNAPLQSSNKNLNNTVFPDYHVPSPSTSWNPRSRVTRSKSVLDYNERKVVPRNNCHRTRSMSYHNFRSSSLSNDIKPSVSARGNQPPIHIPRVRRKNVMNLPVSNSLRSIQRRSSMPERPLSENNRAVLCHRSGSFRDMHSRTPFNSLPSEAFY